MKMLTDASYLKNLILKDHLNLIAFFLLSMILIWRSFVFFKSQKKLTEKSKDLFFLSVAWFGLILAGLQTWK